MAIYTRNGDKGKTAMYGGRPAFKSDARIETYGVIDELTSYLGLVIYHLSKNKDKTLMGDIQKDLYLIMGYLAGAPTTLTFIEEEIVHFEQTIDKEEAVLSPLTHFILPQGTQVSCHLHIARTLCRKAERRVVALSKRGSVSYAPLIKYFNRLSDLLFILARKYNTKEVVITNL